MPWILGHPEQLHLHYKELDLTADGNANVKSAGRFKIDRIQGISRKKPSQTEYLDHYVFSRQKMATKMATDKNGNTVIHLGRVNLPVSDLTLKVGNTYYYRQVEVWSAEEEQDDRYQRCATAIIYKIPGMKQPANVLHPNLSQQRYLKLIIHNGDNPPMDIQEVEIAWERLNIYFIPSANRQYRLLYGNVKVTAPSYELGHLLPYEPEKLNNLPALRISKLGKNPVLRSTNTSEQRGAWHQDSTFPGHGSDYSPGSSDGVLVLHLDKEKLIAHVRISCFAGKAID